MRLTACLKLLLVTLSCGVIAEDVYVLDDTGTLGRVFDGIGGISGGGVSRYYYYHLRCLFTPIITVLGYLAPFSELPREREGSDFGLSLSGKINLRLQNLYRMCS